MVLSYDRRGVDQALLELEKVDEKKSVFSRIVYFFSRVKK